MGDLWRSAASLISSETAGRLSQPDFRAGSSRRRLIRRRAVSFKCQRLATLSVKRWFRGDF